MVSGAVAVVVITGVATADVCTMMEGLASVVSLGHLMATMRMTTMMITRMAAPLDPKMGTFIESNDSHREAVEVSTGDSKESE